MCGPIFVMHYYKSHFMKPALHNAFACCTKSNTIKADWRILQGGDDALKTSRC